MINDIKNSATQRMTKSIESLRHEMAKVRTGRAHASLLDHLHVDYYGSHVPLKQVANVVVEDSRTLMVTPWDRTMIQAVEKAIQTSDLGLNPATAGTSIRIPMPSLTEQRRKDLVKVVRHEAEAGRVAIRNVRREALAHCKDLLKEKKISEDDERRAHDEIQKMTDKFVAEVEKVLHEKEAELMAV